MSAFMDVILFFQSTTRASWQRKLAGVHAFAQSRNWFVQVVERYATPADIQLALKNWNPIGCLVDRAMSTGKAPDAVFNKLPTVYLDQDSRKPSKKHSCLLHDSAATASLAIKELLALKCRSYAYVGTGKKLHWDDDRLDRFKKEAKSAGFCVTELDRNDLVEDIRRLPKPCGILAASDYFAIEAHHAATVGCFKIPEDIAIAGIDNNEQICEMVSPGITSVEPDFKGAGYRLAQMLANEIDRTRSGAARETPPVIERYGPIGIVRRGSTDTGSEQHPVVRRAVEYIRRHACDDTIGLDDVIAEMRCSRRLATFLFKKDTGRTILNEIHERRLERIYELLSHTSAPIATVVSQCGYRSDAFIKKMFLKRTGMTMRDYRKKNQDPHFVLGLGEGT